MKMIGGESPTVSLALIALCFVRSVVDRIPTPVLGECIKIIRQKGVDCESNFLRALLELYQDMPLTVW